MQFLRGYVWIDRTYGTEWNEIEWNKSHIPLSGCFKVERNKFITQLSG